MSDPIEAAAQRLAEAAGTAVPCDPVRDLIGERDIDAAYQVQQRLTERRLAAGARIVGRKIGLTSPAVQQQIGVDRPDFGVLFDDMDVPEGTPVPFGRLLQPKAEAEVAFVLDRDLTDGDLGVADVRAACDYAVAALEIVDSRVRDWDIRITDTVADNASSGMFVLGGRQLALTAFNPVDVTMTLTHNGEQAASGSGSACLGDPLAALSWLARTARDYGSPLRKGDIVLSGALGPMVAVSPGDTVVAEISNLGRVTATFATGDPA